MWPPFRVAGRAIVARRHDFNAMPLKCKRPVHDHRALGHRPFKVPNRWPQRPGQSGKSLGRRQTRHYATATRMLQTATAPGTATMATRGAGPEPMATSVSRGAGPEALATSVSRGDGRHPRRWAPPEAMGATRGDGRHQRRWAPPEALGATRGDGRHQRRWSPPEALVATRGAGRHQRRWSRGAGPEPLATRLRHDGDGPEAMVATRGDGHVAWQRQWSRADGPEPLATRLRHDGDGQDHLWSPPEAMVQRRWSARQYGHIAPERPVRAFFNLHGKKVPVRS